MSIDGKTVNVLLVHKVRISREHTISEVCYGGYAEKGVRLNHVYGWRGSAGNVPASGRQKRMAST
jgi:hypothetical protein